MTSTEIRQKGISAPGNTYIDDTALAQNIGLLCGIGLEIAAQLAEMNERMEVAYPKAGLKQQPRKK